MSKKIAFLFPGQGAQYPGMGCDFFEQFAEAKALFEEADAILQEPFSTLIFKGSAKELGLTKNSQLAIFITSMAILRVVQSQFPDLVPSACAGLSLGEYTALVAAGKLTFKEALILVKKRALFMHEACESYPGTMHVVLGAELSVVEEAIKEVEGVWIANLNCPGQIVISGTKEGVAKAAEFLKKVSRRVMPLDVSGAFHSRLMQEAQDKLEPMIRNASITATSTDVVMNVSGGLLFSTEEIQQAMIQQITCPVRWQKGIETLLEKGVDLFIEIGPGKTLAAMNKRIGVTAPTISFEKVEDLQGVADASIA